MGRQGLFVQQSAHDQREFAEEESGLRHCRTEGYTYTYIPSTRDVIPSCRPFFPPSFSFFLSLLLSFPSLLSCSPPFPSPSPSLIFIPHRRPFSPPPSFLPLFLPSVVPNVTFHTDICLTAFDIILLKLFFLKLFLLAECVLPE